MQDAEKHWDELHQHSRFRPAYPSDHVVRFMMASLGRLEPTGATRFLDVGVGAGRHLRLAADLGFTAFGIDLSSIGLRYARERLQFENIPALLARASMLALPFPESSFQILLSYGVFYYGNSLEMQRAIDETYRVLTPGGRGFIVVRTTEDCRFAKGDRIENNTYRLTTAETNEAGTIQHFLAADDVPIYFAQFSRLSFEKSETTFADRSLLNSDWLVTVEK